MHDNINSTLSRLVIKSWLHGARDLHASGTVAGQYYYCIVLVV